VRKRESGVVEFSEGEFRADPTAAVRAADDAPCVVVRGADGEVRAFILSQREPLDRE
jgi:hypothetical protein